MKSTLKNILLLTLSVPTIAAATVKPNIIIFYVDDLGWQDVQLNDVDKPCPYETPNIIKLAESGMNFTQGYSSSPVCAPARAGIITGQHPAQIAMTSVSLGARNPGKISDSHVQPYLPGPLDLNLLTLADALKENGYRTGHSGKWHVGLTAASYGFDVVNQERGAHRGMADRTKDFATEGDSKYPLTKEKYFPTSEKNPDGIKYPVDEVTDSALDFMEKNKGEPFFLNLCHWMVHYPILTRNEKLLEYYCDKLGQPFPPAPGEMKLPGQQNPYFAAMVTTVDWSLGRVVDYLKTTEDPRNPGKNLIDTTYIFFTSDNGGAEIKGKEIISDNAPLKYGKKHTEDGGVRVPTVITGPGIKGGSRFDGLFGQLDCFPTIMQLTGTKIDPAEEAKLSGLDISPVLKGESDKIVDSKGVEREHLFWHFPHNSMDNMKTAVRSGDFKLHKKNATGEYELFQLTKDGKRHDYEESNNLAKNPEYSSVLDRLIKLMEADLVKFKAEGPYLNPQFKGHEAPSAAITKSAYDAGSRVATLTLDSSKPTIETAYVIYLSDPAVPEKRHNKMPAQAADAKLPGMRRLADISADGHSVTATIPAEIANHCFVIIDSNGYMAYSEARLKSDEVDVKKPKKERKKKKDRTKK